MKLQDLNQMKEIAIEHLLENEALTSNLDDESADVLTRWGIDCIEMVFHSLDAITEEQIKLLLDKLSSIELLMRLINQWANNREEVRTFDLVSWLAKIYTSINNIYEDYQILPSMDDFLLFLENSNDKNPGEFILSLRAMVEERNQINFES